MFGGDADTSEVIWKFDNVQGLATALLVTVTATRGDFIEASRELREAFSSGDIRRDIAIVQNVSDNTGDSKHQQISTQCRYQLYQ